jgi:hypothetical protein
MNAAEQETALALALAGEKSLAQSAASPKWLNTLGWELFDKLRADGRFKLKMIGISIVDISAVLEQLLMVPLIGPRPAAN